ncbi:hypothetical protein OEZ85_005630 [Tetradesmus obliquus]|uniref:EGF-like domain-containing protein n=1 Tax=Tetradesmus obliquus TaxID=3088 RepID=A0ABY8UE19_TETOB|nr:hypothetical protein OEZ85_005630 [Tetradesmus obliquus]
MELHTKGFCVPRQAWQLQPAYAEGCPADTYLQNDYNGKQVCAATRCTGPFGVNKKPASIPQAKNTLLGQAVSDAIANAPATYWGGDSGTVCNTILLKPIMTCGEGCITDNRLYGDWCICPNDYMACPYNTQNTGYQWCQCEQLGPPYGLCVADPYYCAYYCQYAPSWIFTAIAKSTMLCPIDPSQIEPYNPDPINPGWDTTINNP